MPLYEYKCSACAHRFERIVKFSDAPVTKCPKCGKDTLDQLISAPAIQFKGTGWYETDYARKGRNSGSDSSASEGSDSAKLQGGSETASASKDGKSGNGSNGSSSETSGSSSSENASSHNSPSSDSHGSNASNASNVSSSSNASNSAASSDSASHTKGDSTGNGR